MLLRFCECELRYYAYGDALKTFDPFFYAVPDSSIADNVHELMTIPCKPRDRRGRGIQTCNTFHEICLKQEINVIGDFLLRIALEIRRIKEFKTGTIKLRIGCHFEQYVAD